MNLHCWTDRQGVITFGKAVPADMRGIAQAEARALRLAVTVSARHAYDGKTLLVPGVPEAADDKAAELAVRLYARQVARRLGHDDEPALEKGLRVAVADHDWDKGLVELHGTVTRLLSPTHVAVKLDNGLRVAAPIAACELANDERRAA